MSWKFFSPNDKKKRYEEQLSSGKDHLGNDLSDSDKAYREGYNRAVKENNRLFAFKNSTPEQRETYKAKRREERQNRRNKNN